MQNHIDHNEFDQKLDNCCEAIDHPLTYEDGTLLIYVYYFCVTAACAGCCQCLETPNAGGQGGDMTDSWRGATPRSPTYDFFVRGRRIWSADWDITIESGRNRVKEEVFRTVAGRCKM